MLKQQLGCGMPKWRFAHAKPLCSKSTQSYTLASHPEASIAALPTTVSLVVISDAGLAVTSTAHERLSARRSAQAALPSALRSRRCEVRVRAFRPTYDQRVVLCI